MTDAAPLPADKSLPHLMKGTVRKYGSRCALSCILPNGWSASLTYEQLDHYSDAFAAYLVSVAGVEKGSVVAIQAPNILGYPIALLGALKAGAVVSGVNPLYTVKETLRQLIDSEVSVFIGFDIFGTQIEEVMKDRPQTKLIILSANDFFPQPQRTAIAILAKYVKKVVPSLSVPHISLMEACERGEKLPPVGEEKILTGEEVCFHAYSGGTTGIPKGVTLTSQGLLTNVMQVQAVNPEIYEKTDRTALLVLPLYHMYGVFVFAMTLANGSHLALAPSPRPLSNLKKAFEKAKPDVFSGVNTLFAGLLEEDWFKGEIAQRIELTFSGATALAPSVRQAWKDRTTCDILESYGMTEATTVLTTNPTGEKNRPDSVGVPLPGTFIRIVKDDGTEAPVGERGEVQAKGPQIMPGYYKAPELTEAAFDDGWLKTGDVGIMDAQGYLRIVDRVKDMIIVSGFNVYPGEIEAVISSVPGVHEVGVVGREDEKSGEVPVAFVVKSQKGVDVQDILDHCEKDLTRYKLPKDIQFVDELPKSPVGKVLRRELR
ncbi:MAG: AMP-binding protein, partial [Pseudomonadota bacterium]